MEVRRGQIWYVKIPCWTGEEMPKNRPGVVVSCNELNERSGCVLMALLSESEQHIGEPYVAVIHSTGVESHAVCHKLVTVDKTRLGTYMGTCTAQEMRAIEKAIMASLKLKGGKDEEACSDASTSPAESFSCEWEPLGHADPVGELGTIGPVGPQGDCGVQHTCKHVVKLENTTAIKQHQIIGQMEEIAQLRKENIRLEAQRDAYQWQVQGLMDRMTMSRGG